MVLASLNSARSKGNAAAIKSNLKNMIPQAELAYDTPGNYSTACAAVAKMMTAITNAGGTSACYTYDNTRWGVSVKLNSDETKKWAVDVNGVVDWNYGNEGIFTWDAGNTRCATLGMRMPSAEELKAIQLIYGAATPPGFVTNSTWSGTQVPSDSTKAYYVNIGADGSVLPLVKTTGQHVHCVH